MRRREFINLTAGAAMAWPLVARAQQPDRIWRIGFLRVGRPPAAFIDGFLQGMRDQGAVENQHFVIEYSLAENAELMPEAAGELVGRKVDIIIASGTPSVVPARNAAGPIPVVFVATLDPVATGLIASLGKPGGNITGMTSISGDIIAKRLQLAKELLPNLTKIAILVREASPTTAQYLQESRNAARALGLDLHILTERNPNDLEEIFVSARGSDAMVVADDAEFTDHRDQIAELAVRDHLPTVSGLRELVEAGCLMAYGASFGALYRRAAGQVRKIMQGVKPANLPVEQPTKFEFLLNMRTAKALGIVLPPTVVARADGVIE
jgi:putative tryptophan/tyrosine transport system substrate-binding protein